MKTKKNQTTISSKESVTDHWQTGLVGIFNLLLLTVPLFFTFNTEELFEFNKMVLVYFLSICIGVVWILRMTVHRKIIFRSTQLDIPILAFLLSQLLSTVFSIHPYTSLLGYYTRFHGGLISTICYIGLYYAFVSNLERKHLKGLAITLFAGVAITSLYAILEHFGHSFSCYLVTQGQSFGTDCWVQDVKGRVFSTFGQPNWLAAYLITVLPLSLTFSTFSQKKWIQISSIAVTIIMFITLLFTRSRSGILGLAVGLGLYFVLLILALLYRKKDSIRTIAQKIWPVWLLCIVFSLLFLSINNPFSDVFTNLIRSTKTEQIIPTTPSIPDPSAPVVNRLEIGGSDSGEIRKIVWKGALQVWKRYPILGSGVETFAYSYYQDRPIEHNSVSEWDFLYNKAHNEFLNFLATTGIVGLGTYCIMLGAFSYFTFRRYLSAIKNHETGEALLFSSLLAGELALSISNFFGFSTVAVTVLLFLFFGLPDVLTRDTTDSVPLRNSELVSWQYSIMVLTSIVGIILLFKVSNYWTADVAFAKGKVLLAQGEIGPGFASLNEAIKKTPQEALFYDTLSAQYASYAIEFAKIGEATNSAQLAQEAVHTNDLVMQLNSRNINYYKTRAQVFITLSAIDNKYLEEAKKTLETARSLAPTDPKLTYNLGLIELALGQEAQGIADLEETVALKPNYEAARMQLASNYEQQNKFSKAIAQYQYILSNIKPDSTMLQEKIATLSAKLQK